jgi:hypothetical protein
MRLVGKIFSAIFALIAVPLFTMAACNLALEAAFLNRDTYDGVLEDDVIFEEVLTVALPAIFSASDAEGLDFEGRDESPIQIRDVVQALEDKPEVWAEAANLLIPPEWLQQTTTQFVDVLFSITDGNFDAIDEVLDLSEVRQRFAGEEAEQAAILIISEAPACTDAQIRELRAFFSTRGGEMPICNPPDDSTREQSIELLKTWFSVAALYLGEDQLSISDFGLTRDSARAINTLVELDRQSLLLVYLIPMAFLSLIVIFTVRSSKSFGRWIGGTSIASGVMILMAIFMLQVAVINIISEALSANTEAEQLLARLFSEILRSIFAQSSSSMLLQAALFIGIGFLLIVLSGFIGRKTDDTGSSVLITEDGEIISTATQKRIGRLTPDDNG